jgi:hypothetical protein
MTCYSSARAFWRPWRFRLRHDKSLDASCGKFSGSFINTDAFIETLYNSLTGQKGKFVKHD